MSICQELNEEPDEDILLAYREEDYPDQLQWAFYLYSLMKPIIYGMGDVYVGKDLKDFDTLIRYHPVSDPETVFQFVLYIDRVHTAQIQEKTEKERKKLEREQKKNANQSVRRR